MREYLLECMGAKATHIKAWPLDELKTERDRLKSKREQALDEIWLYPGIANLPAMLQYITIHHELLAVERVLELRLDDPDDPDREIAGITFDLPRIV